MMKAEKYIIQVEANGQMTSKIRYGFGAASEEVQKILEANGTSAVRVRIEGLKPEATFVPTPKPWRLLDIKQRIKQLKVDD